LGKTNDVRDEAIRFILADPAWKSRIALDWNENAARHLHFDDGFTILATLEGEAVGLLSVYWQELSDLTGDTTEGYIDIIEVVKEYRRLGIARYLLKLAAERASKRGAFQLRTWSSNDKTEVLSLWRSLDFDLAPAVTFPGGQEVHGPYVTMVLRADRS
jgi:ribosomal protein S18 acetylase RimI-like enzyme